VCESHVTVPQIKPVNGHPRIRCRLRPTVQYGYKYVEIPTRLHLIFTLVLPGLTAAVVLALNHSCHALQDGRERWHHGESIVQVHLG
jgi:hypothetical protein